MQSFRCVVQDCSNASDHTTGISLHKSPTNKSLRRIWAKLVETKSTNFNPGSAELRFVVCSEHFASECFERSVHISGSVRRLKTGAVPTIWKKGPANISSANTARLVHLFNVIDLNLARNQHFIRAEPH